MIRPKSYPALADAIEVGALLGYRRAFKHVEKPDEDQIIENIKREILNEIFERFDIDY